MKIIHGLFFCILAALHNSAQAADYAATIDFSPPQQLSLPLSGVIKTVTVAAGQRVRQGDELLALDPLPFLAAKTQAQSLVSQQQTMLVESQRDLLQQQELYERTVLATVELENAELRVKRDQAKLDSARAQLVIADYELSYSRITAPFDALILSVPVNPGQAINNAVHSQTLIRLVRQGHYQALFYLPPAAPEQPQIGQAVSINSDGKTYRGVISSIDYSIDPQSQKAAGDSRRLRVTAAFETQQQAAVIGSSASVSID